MPSTVPVIKVASGPILVRNFLIRTNAVTALVGDRIRTAHVVDPDRVPEYPFVILDFELAGDAGYQGGIQRIPFHIYTYSTESPQQTKEIYDTVYLALQAQRLSDSTSAGADLVITAKGSVRETSRPVTMWNEQLRSWFTRGSWVAMLAG